MRIKFKCKECRHERDIDVNEKRREHRIVCLCCGVMSVIMVVNEGISKGRILENKPVKNRTSNPVDQGDKEEPGIFESQLHKDMFKQ